MCVCVCVCLFLCALPRSDAGGLESGAHVCGDKKVESLVRHVSHFVHPRHATTTHRYHAAVIGHGYAFAMQTWGFQPILSPFVRLSWVIWIACLHGPFVASRLRLLICLRIAVSCSLLVPALFCPRTSQYRTSEPPEPPPPPSSSLLLFPLFLLLLLSLFPTPPSSAPALTAMIHSPTPRSQNDHRLMSPAC